VKGLLNGLELCALLILIHSSTLKQMKITMKRSLKIVFIICALAFQNVQAGNPDRAGGAGATQLLFNPYARSFGYGGVNTASVKGLESFYLNIAGLANSEKTEGDILSSKLPDRCWCKY
jgi:hypothetical protein